MCSTLIMSAKKKQQQKLNEIFLTTEPLPTNN